MLKYPRYLLVLTILMSFPAFAFAQLTIQGTVTDRKGEALPGANVLVVGTTLGTATGIDGSYSLLLPDPEGETVIEARFIGYQSVQKSVTQNTGTVELNFELQIDALQFDEVVVTGTSVATSKKQLGNAISTVSVKEIEKSGANAIDRALSGKFAGVLVQQNSGNPAGGVSIRLRGPSTVRGSADPLYVVDGVIVDNSSPILIDLGGGATNRLVDLNPNDIERIEIVKGASAAALYGSRANNGVVQIFTKRGQQGKPRITYTSRISTYDVRKTLDVNMAMNDQGQFIDNDGDPLDGQRFDWQDFIFRRAIGSEQYFSVSGGASNTRYFASASYLTDEGVVDQTLFRRYSGRARVEQVLTDWANLSIGANYIFDESDDVPQGGLTSNYGSLTGFIFGPNTFDPRPDPQSGQYPNQGILANPVEVIDRYEFGQEVSRTLGDAQLTLTPAKGLSIEYILGLDSYEQTAKAFIPKGTSAPGLANGFSRKSVRDFLQVNNDINIRYQNSVSDNLQSTSLLGATLQFERAETFSAQATQLSPVSEIVPSGANQVIGEFRSEQTIYGIFGQQTFGFKDRLFLTGAIRFDASSSFGEDDRWQFYPKGSISYLISDEDFWRDGAFGNLFPSFKLRGSIGASGGLTAIGPFDRFTNFNPVSYDGNSGLLPSAQLGAIDVKPERQREIEVGADFSLFSNRLGFEVTYYDQHTTDLLLFRSVSFSTGFSSRLQNVGEMDNKGLELLIRAIPLDRPNFRWTSAFTFATNNNEVNGIEEGRLILPASFGLVAAINGEPLGVFFGDAFERDANGNIVLDENGLPVETPEREIVGDPNPDFTASFINSVDIGRRWSFRVQFDAVIGNDVFNFTRRLAALSVFGTLKDFERELEGDLPSGYNARLFGILGEPWIEDGSFVKLRELSATYNWYPRFLGLNSIRLSLIGRNLLSIDDYSGYDPEINVAGQRTGVRGFDFVEVPIPRSISFEVSLAY
ncbi:SusC/RagA family TonB-linked outer membrane protein [candidate division KSB1 bacterium]|nr:SusC/RagA family TonB-linked outer membrane protein [candidate division KSB1 bacterium]NIR70426.1 SusC/RagA family TonB-linked outer membrane protein [candidate division KSB1 bacterium]NIS25965.1 SusC/RagA family TonB-linked outer membrane protein [candidate division KSB1 bacterium]NIT69988.1 SusC/RagA family TonB-linked outer membrane protein [candidate division KSB1 bacterium]NIU26654.1 SusC/RagA family TonB-linked outer membrane protein [candidate division KSB1 bacterium]